MIIEFKTARNKTNGYRKYLCIDTGPEIYTRNNPRMITEGVEIKTGDYNELIKKLQALNYKEVERVY